MLPIVIPVVFYLTKNLTKRVIVNAISDGVNEARSEILKTLVGYQTENVVKILINILSLLFVTLILPIFFDKDIVIFSICTIYMASILDGVISNIKNIPEVLKFIFEYKLNLKRYIYNKTYLEARGRVSKEISEMNFFKRMLNDMFGKSQHEYASDIAFYAVRGVFSRVLNVFIIAPILIEAQTGFGSLKSAIYPILYTIDFFFGTYLLGWIL